MENEWSYFSAEEEKNKQALIKLDLEVCEFYFKAIDTFLREGDREHDIKNIRHCLHHISCLSDSIRQNHQTSNEIMSNRELDEELNKLQLNFYYKILYIYWNSTCFSSAVARHFRTFLDEQSCVLKEFKSKKSIRICSLGSGSLSDVIAMVKVLKSKLNDKNMNIHISVIDIDEGWKHICFSVLKKLKRFSSKTLNFEFVVADLTKPFRRSVKQIIENADIISVVKLLSEMNYFFKRWKMFSKVQAVARPGSILFFLDCADHWLLKGCGGILGEIFDYYLVYEAVYDMHMLDEAVVERQFHLYNDGYNISRFHTYIMLLSRVWLKAQSDPLKEISFKPVNEEFTQIQMRLAQKEAELLKVKEEYQLFRMFEMKSFRAWKTSVTKKMIEEGRNKKEIREVIKPVRNSINEKLEPKNNLVISVNEEFMSQKQQLEDLKASKEIEKRNYITAHRKRAFAMLDTYEQSSRELFLHLEQKYPFCFLNNEKDIH
ncbi:uncharacterized protein NPIL_538111 [Nephila pilipes]|uniref:Uncharacterized protein n=1 Tax=Nephila pilipes TaxID=299642 RepID=A0A8X6TUS6_NEPPI|nr:uncharacterized protein NPIL_538111 [Nephila pilipes]